MSATATPAEPLERVLGPRETLHGTGPRLFELVPSERTRTHGHTRLFERERFGGGGGERAGEPLRRREVGRLPAVRLALRRPVGQVEARFLSSTSAGDVAPLMERANVVEEDEGALYRRALGGVGGECVAVLEVLGRVVAVDRTEGA